jgi:hypothetical protein
MADITKADVKREADKRFEVKMNSSEFKSKVEKIVKDRIKNEKELEDRVVDITKNVITQLYKALWMKRGFWRNMLKNQST